MGYLWEYRGLLFAVGALVLYGAVSGATGWATLKRALLGYMLRAEKAARTGDFGVITGEQLMDVVVQLTMVQVVPRLPLSIRPFVTEALVRKWAQKLYEWARDYLDDGKINGSLAA